MSAPRHPPRVVIAGGGVAGLEALVALRSLAEGEAELHLVCPNEQFSLRALGSFERFGTEAARAYRIDAIAADLGVMRHRDALAGVRADEHAAVLRSGAEAGYEALVIAVGAHARPAFARGACFGGGPRSALDRVVDDLRARPGSRLAVVVPAAVTWTLPAYEIALAAAADAPGTHVTVVTHEPEPLAAFGPPGAAMVREELAVAGVTLVEGVEADVPADGLVDLAAHGALEADHVVHLPVLAGPDLPGVACDADGFVRVDDHWRAGGEEDVYAVGDATTGEVKQGGLAAAHAGAVAAALAARLTGAPPPAPVAPVLRGLLRTARGPRYLRAAGGECLVSEQPLWWPPSKVASRWLAPWLAARDLASAERVAG